MQFSDNMSTLNNLRRWVNMRIAIAVFSGNAAGANYRAVYDYEFTKDGINAIKAKEGSDATSFPHRRSSFMVTKSYTSDTICIKDRINSDIYEYNVSKSEFHWQLCDSTKMIYGYEAYKAVCSYHGRKWVFCGLPGLIFEAHDNNYLFSFRLVGLMSNQELKEDWLDEGEKTDRFSFLKKEYRYRKNSTAIFNTALGTNIPENDNDTRYLDGLEPDFKRQ